MHWHSPFLGRFSHDQQHDCNCPLRAPSNIFVLFCHSSRALGSLSDNFFCMSIQQNARVTLLGPGFCQLHWHLPFLGRFSHDQQHDWNCPLRALPGLWALYPSFSGTLSRLWTLYPPLSGSRQYNQMYQATRDGRFSHSRES